MHLSGSDPMLLASGFFSVDGAGPEILVGIAILGGLLTLFKAVPKVTGMIARVDIAVRQIVGDEHQPGISDRLKTVEAELKPNGGGSMRDAVNRVEKGMGAAADVAAEAKIAADHVAAKLVLSEEQAKRERTRISTELKEGRGMMHALLNSLDEFAQDVHTKEIAVLRAFKGIGIDLTDIGDALVEEPSDET